MIGHWWFEPVNHEDAFDHVANSCGEGPVGEPYGHHTALRVARAPNSAIDAHNARRAAKAWDNKVEFGRTLRQHAGC